MYPKETPKSGNGASKTFSLSRSSGASGSSNSQDDQSESSSGKAPFEGEDEKIDLLLQKLGSILESYDRFNFVIAMDIEDVFFPEKTLMAGSKTDIGSISLSRQLKKKQETWLIKLNTLFQKHPNIFLVYNTTSPLVPDMPLSRKKNKMLSYTVDQTKIKLPAPDAIISNTGARITKESAMLGDRISRINQQLSQWLEEDNGDPVNMISPLQGVYKNKQPFLIFDNITSGSAAGAGFEQFISNLNELFIHRFGLHPRHYSSVGGKGGCSGECGGAYTVQSLPYTILTPLTENNDLKKVLFSNTRINKGSTLEILLNIMRLDKTLGDGLTFLVVLGTSINDLPMIRYDEAANALSPLTVEQKQLATSSLKSLALNYEISNDVFWLKSIAFNDLNLNGLTNPHISRMLDHEKVVKVNSSPGIASVLEAIVDALKPDELDTWNVFLNKYGSLRR